MWGLKHFKLEETTKNQQKDPEKEGKTRREQSPGGQEETVFKE